MRLLLLALAVAAAAISAGAALAVGPWPGLAQTVVAPTGDHVRFTAVRADGATTLRARGADGGTLAAATFAGDYGIPAVTSTGVAGGLSPDGRLLVLAEPPSYQRLRDRSSFLLVSTKTLSLVRKLVLRGELGFDAISPDGRTLYLIQHASRSDLFSYAVRAYDLRTQRLLPHAIVDRREPDEAMKGFPVARATSPHGTWVFTLYLRTAGKPFVHALNAAARTAFCIDLPSAVPIGDMTDARLVLSARKQQLLVRDGSDVVARIDTKTMRVLD
jgi:hypothetical protein